jgi:hypothetical protein
MFRALIACAALVIAACATTPAPAPVASNATAQKPPCTPEATRLPQKDCGPGSTYNQTDISATGQPEPAPALKMLDPRVNTH